MKALNLYLNFDGNCEEAFNFYKEVLNGKFNGVSRFNEMPADPEFKIPEDFANKIMHINMELPNGLLLMGSDTGGDWAPDFKKGNNFSISLDFETREEADEIFEKLSDGGKITMPMNETFWGSYFGTFEDKFGINWMFSVG